MKKIFLGALVLVVSAAAVASAEPVNRVVTLKDGSTVQGKILGIDKGAYIVASPALGELRVKEEDVVSIASPGAVTAPQPAQPLLQPQAGGAELQAAQARMMADPALMADIQSIASDPEVVALVSDPAFLQAAQSKNISAIQANPRTAQLMNNPKVKALIEKMRSAHGQ